MKSKITQCFYNVIQVNKCYKLVILDRWQVVARQHHDIRFLYSALKTSLSRSVITSGRSPAISNPLLKTCYYFYQRLKPHISELIYSCFFHPRNIRKIKPLLPSNDLELLVQTYILLSLFSTDPKCSSQAAYKNQQALTHHPFFKFNMI